VGFNVPHDNAAVGFCGSAVPNGTVRSILDYVGDGSKPGSFEKYPCDTTPKPVEALPGIKDQILNPPADLNSGKNLNTPGGPPLATGKWANGTYGGVVTVVKPWFQTSYVCPPGSSQTVAVIHSLSEGVPVTLTSTLGSQQTKGSEYGLSAYSPANGKSSDYGNEIAETSTGSGSVYTTTVNGQAIVETSTPVGFAAASGVAGASGSLQTTPSAFTGDASRSGTVLLALGGSLLAFVILI